LYCCCVFAAAPAERKPVPSVALVPVFPIVSGFALLRKLRKTGWFLLPETRIYCNMAW
jgi:hypothetical protein